MRDDGRLPDWADVPARVVDVPPAIDASGRRDVTDDLNRFFASAPAGSVIRFPENGRYRIEDSVEIVERRDLFVDGNGATLYATTPGHKNRAHLRIKASSNVTVRGLRVRGANPEAGYDGPFVWEKEHQHGIDVRNSDHVALVGVTVSDVYGDLVHVGRTATTVPWASNVVIRDSDLARSGRMGIAIVAARDVVVEGNRLDDLRRSVIDFEPGGDPLNEHGTAHGVERVVIRDNDVGRARLNFIAAAGKGVVDDITVEGNRLRGTAMQVYVVSKGGGRRSGWQVIGNRSDLRFNAPHGAVMRFTRVDGIVVRGNHQILYDTDSNDLPMVGVEVADTCGDLDLDGNTYGEGFAQSRIVGGC